MNPNPAQRIGERRRANGIARPELSAESIVDAALEIVDTSGLDALSMRKLAAQLGVSPMGLYSYFESKDDLLDRMADTVLERLEFPIVPGGDWKAQVRAIMQSLRGLLLSHPGVVRLFITRRVVTRALTRSIDATLGVLRDAGLPHDRLAPAYSALFTFTLGFVVFEIPRTLPEDAEESERHVAERLALMSERRFPHVSDLASELAGMSASTNFDYGLDRLLDGLGQQLIQDDQ